MSLILQSKRYGECWNCDKLNTIFKVGYKYDGAGTEWICRDCLEEVRSKTKRYFRRKKLLTDKLLT